MSYLNKNMLADGSVAGPVLLTSVADILYFPMPMKQVVQRIMALVTTAVVSSAPVSVAVYSRPTHGSTSGQVLLGTLNIPGGASVGQCYYKDIADNLAPVNAGQELVFSVTVAAAGGGAAGAAIPMALVDDSPEEPLNQPNLVLSA